VIPRLWPNPAKDVTYVSLDADKLESAYYKVYDATGSLTSTGVWHLSKGKNVMELKISHLPPGIYQLVISKNNRPVTVRFVRQ
jgi:hypothetical protein